MRYCRDCRHFEQIYSPPDDIGRKVIGFGELMSVCRRQLVSTVTGESHWIEARACRTDESLCGLEAQWFEKRRE